MAHSATEFLHGVSVYGAATVGGENIATEAYVQQQVALDSGYSTLIGDGVAAEFTVAHGLATTDVLVQVYDVATGATVHPSIQRVDANSVSIGYDDAAKPTADEHKVLVKKIG